MSLPANDSFAEPAFAPEYPASVAFTLRKLRQLRSEIGSQLDSLELNYEALASQIAALEPGIAPTWNNLPGKPDTFPPEAHTHTVSGIDDWGSSLTSWWNDLSILDKLSSWWESIKDSVSFGWTQITGKPDDLVVNAVFDSSENKLKLTKSNGTTVDFAGQVQVDWNDTNSSSTSYIKNVPDTVVTDAGVSSDGTTLTLTLTKRNGSTVSFQGGGGGGGVDQYTYTMNYDGSLIDLDQIEYDNGLSFIICTGGLLAGYDGVIFYNGTAYMGSLDLSGLGSRCYMVVKANGIIIVM